MNVLVECKCSVTGLWSTVAHFKLGSPALDAAKALSKLDGCEYRVTDNRYPDEGPALVWFYTAGEFVG